MTDPAAARSGAAHHQEKGEIHEDDQARDRQDLPRRDDSGNAADAERPEWAGYPLTWGDEG